jgi:hypothetical protein
MDVPPDPDTRQQDTCPPLPVNMAAVLPVELVLWVNALLMSWSLLSCVAPCEGCFLFRPLLVDAVVVLVIVLVVVVVVAVVAVAASDCLEPAKPLHKQGFLLRVATAGDSCPVPPPVGLGPVPLRLPSGSGGDLDKISGNLFLSRSAIPSADRPGFNCPRFESPKGVTVGVVNKLRKGIEKVITSSEPRDGGDSGFKDDSGSGFPGMRDEPSEAGRTRRIEKRGPEVGCSTRPEPSCADTLGRLPPVSGEAPLAALPMPMRKPRSVPRFAI